MEDAYALAALGAQLGLSTNVQLASNMAFFLGAARWLSGERRLGLGEMRDAARLYREHGLHIGLRLSGGFIAAALAEEGEIDAGLEKMDRALEEISSTGECWYEGEVHRIRGEILLKRDPANTALAEEVFLTAIAIAQQQRARSFELRAGLALAKLYQSTNHATDAHAILDAALQGFSPTSEFSRD
jgi:predicted ATPase